MSGRGKGTGKGIPKRQKDVLSPPHVPLKKQREKTSVDAGTVRAVAAKFKVDPKDVKVVPRPRFGGTGVAPPPSLGYKTYGVADSAGWNTLFKEAYHGESRPAMAQVNLSHKRTGKDSSSNFEFGLSFQERAKKQASKVKLNPVFHTKGVQDIYYSKENPKFKEVDEETNTRNKVALDDVGAKYQSLQAQDIMRVMKGTAGTKGLSSPSGGDRRDLALIAGSLIMTSERYRNPLNPYNAHIELYKVKHMAHVDESRRQDLSKVFDVKEGTFVAAQSGGAEKSRKQVTDTHLGNLINDEAMKDIFANHASKKDKHENKTFEEWRDYKINKMNTRYPPGK